MTTRTFVGAHSTRFDFNGLPEKNFCLYTDRAVHVNMGMRGYLDSRSTQSAALVVNGSAVRTWIRQLAVMWTDADSDNTVSAKPAAHSLVLTARDGKEQLRGDSGFLASAEIDGTPLPRLTPGETRSLAGGKLSLEFVGEEKTGTTPADAQVHINVMFTDASASSSVHGVMGQTLPRWQGGAHGGVLSARRDAAPPRVRRWRGGQGLPGRAGEGL
ncbi:unnamed protein product [Closterium sp. Naga37s-1]|nr:unnamed protein product [Closterium sp. Naga37s-1]